MEGTEKSFSQKMSERLLVLASGVIKIDSELCKSYAGKHIFGQLFRAVSSAGANYEESIGAESKADFIHKSQIVLKELRESYYWLRLIFKSKLLPEDNVDFKFLMTENFELIKIISKSLVTAKQNKVSRN